MVQLDSLVIQPVHSIIQIPLVFLSMLRTLHSKTILNILASSKSCHCRVSSGFDNVWSVPDKIGSSSKVSEEAITTSASQALGFEPTRTPTYMRRESFTDYHFPIEDRPELAQIATILSRAETQATVRTQPKVKDEGDSHLERKDTVAQMELNDPTFDPEKPEFNFHLWVRKFIRSMEEQGIKQRRAGFVFKNLTISGSGAALQLQNNVASLLMAPFRLQDYLGHAPEKQILRNFNGSVRSGEMLIVLGRPGSGCSTFLKAICGELAGLQMDDKSVVHYNGIPQERFIKELKGDIVYNQENEKHFPHLTVGQTLEFAAAARTSSARVFGVPRQAFSRYMAKIAMNIFGLSHTRNTKVGNDFVRGVSGGKESGSVSLKWRWLVAPSAHGIILLGVWTQLLLLKLSDL